jgi:hypothetical protein
MKRIAFLFYLYHCFTMHWDYLMFAQQDEQAWVSTIENTQTQS